MEGLTAPRKFSPGEVIFRETPFAEFLCRDYKDVACEYCYKKVPNLKLCKECLSVKYCGKPCQKKDWKNHKLECKNLKNLPTDGVIDIIRLIGNIILRIKDKDWKSFKSTVLETEVSFDDIYPSLEEYRQTRLQNLFCNTEKERVRRFIGDQNMPNDDDFWKIYGKVYHLTRIGRMIASSCETVSFAIGTSLIKRECIPNCHVTRHGRTWSIWTLKKIKRSEKLCLNEFDVLSSPSNFEAILGPCKCTDCRLPYKESILSRVIDDQGALEAIATTEEFLTMWYSFPIVQGMPFMEILVDCLLDKQEGVLGNTNALHLKLLAIRCLDIGGHPFKIMDDLLKLERNAVSVFGAYYPEMTRIYKALAEVYFTLGDTVQGAAYVNKIKVIRNYELQ